MSLRLLAFSVVTASCSSFAQGLNLKGSYYNIPTNTGIHSVSRSVQYLISSFPNIKTVAYTHLPDTVWRPLDIGEVVNPVGVVADAMNNRLFVADRNLSKIFWYDLIIEPDGLLKTDGQQHVAVDGYIAYWMSVDGLGDLYFTGQEASKGPNSHRAVYRMDNGKITRGDAMNPFEVYSRSNSGFPTPHAWEPSGIAVNSFMIYWGNGQAGQTYGAVCSGTRKNIGVKSADIEVNVVNEAVSDVRGMAMTGTNLFYLTPDAVYGTVMSSYTLPEKNAKVGLIQSTNVPGGSDPQSIAYDGVGTLYWTDAKAGRIYQIPAGDMSHNPIEKYIDAPLVHGVTVFSLSGYGLHQAKVRTESGTIGALRSSAKAVESEASSDLRLNLFAVLCSLFMVFTALPQ